MPILIWGAGAMGGTIGAALLRVGRSVLLVDQDLDHVVAMRDDGLSIRGPVAEFRVEADAVTPAEMSTVHDRVLLCVKAHHTDRATRELVPFVSDAGFVVSVQNGLNEEVLARHLGRERTVGAFVNFGADYLGPGEVHWGGRGAVVVGELDGRRTPRIQGLRDMLASFEPQATITSNISGYLWAKLAYGALLFATALTDESIADVLDDEAFRELEIAIVREVLSVAVAVGAEPEPFDGFDPESFLQTDPVPAQRSLDGLVAFNRKSAKTHSGIWRDLAVRKRKTEVAALLDPVVEAGRRLGISTALVIRIAEMVHDIEEGSRPQSRGNLTELAVLANPQLGIRGSPGGTEVP